MTELIDNHQAKSCIELMVDSWWLMTYGSWAVRPGPWGAQGGGAHPGVWARPHIVIDCQSGNDSFNRAYKFQ